MDYLLGIKYDGLGDERYYPYNIPAVRHLKKVGKLDFSMPVTFFVGENGTGKSTLLEAIAIALGFNPEGGSRDHLFSTRDTHSELSEHISIIKQFHPKDGYFLRAESFYNNASYLDDNSNMNRYGGVSFHEQSHGESFFSLIENRFEGNGIYLLDEPEAALSPQRLMSLIILIDRIVKKNSQFIIATHSPIVMAYPNSEIMQFTDEGMRKVAYRETDHYQITKQFIDRPEQMIKYLLSEED
jgi:predicted ATPase